MNEGDELGGAYAQLARGGRDATVARGEEIQDLGYDQVETVVSDSDLQLGRLGQALAYDVAGLVGVGVERGSDVQGDGLTQPLQRTGSVLVLGTALDGDDGEIGRLVAKSDG